MDYDKAVKIFIEVEDGRNGSTQTFQEIYLGMSDDETAIDMLAEYIVSNGDICKKVIEKIVEKIECES